MQWNKPLWKRIVLIVFILLALISLVCLVFLYFYPINDNLYCFGQDPSSFAQIVEVDIYNIRQVLPFPWLSDNSRENYLSYLGPGESSCDPGPFNVNGYPSY
jgi:hypothetical protein